MRPYGAFLIISGGTAFGTACAYTLNLVFQIRTVGLDPLQLVLVGTVLETSYLLAQIPSGVLADLRGRRRPVVAGVFLTGAGTLVPALTPTYPAILIATAATGVGLACVEGALEAWLADELGDHRVGSAVTRGAQVGQAATVLGVVVAAVLAPVRLDLPIVIGALVWLVLGLVLVAVMREHHRPSGAAPSVAAAREQLATGIRAIRRQPVLLALVGAALCGSLGAEGYDRLGQDHLLGSGSTVGWLGGLAVVAALVAIPLTEVVRRRGTALDPDRLARVVVGLEVVQVAGMVGFALAGRFVAAAAAWLLVEVARSVVSPLWTTWLVARTVPATRATVLSAVGVVGAVGEIVGGPPVGWIGRRFSVGPALLASALLTAPAIALTARARRHQRPTPGGATAPDRPDLDRPGATVVGSDRTDPDGPLAGAPTPL